MDDLALTRQILCLMIELQVVESAAKMLAEKMRMYRKWLRQMQ